MSIIDIVILVPFAFALYKGIKNGFVGQIAGISGIVLGIILGTRFSALVSGYISQWIEASESVIKIISFAIIIVLVIIAAALLSKAIEKLFSFVMLGWLNKLLGVLLAFAGTAFILGAVICLISYVNETWFTIIPQEKIAESVLYQPLEDLANMVFPYFKNLFQK
ncbi:MAG: CvpA family protein [Bacteroidales bacterium]|nr:CvpA family protein [Bacteroidales bacterium]